MLDAFSGAVVTADTKTAAIGGGELAALKSFATASILDDRCLNGLKETRYNKNDAAQGDCSAIASEAAGYFDRVMSALS